MVNGGVQPPLGRNLHHVTALGWIVARGGNELRPKCGEFYNYVDIESMLRGFGLFTHQRPFNGATGRVSPGAIPGANRDPPRGITEHPDRETAGSVRGLNGNHYRCYRPGGPGTTVLTLELLHSNKGIYLDSVAGGEICHRMGRLHPWLGLAIFPQYRRQRTNDDHFP